MFNITAAQLKIFSGICSNMVVVFLIAIPVTRDLGVLIIDIIGATLFWKLGVRTEEILEEIS